MASVQDEQEIIEEEEDDNEYMHPIIAEGFDVFFNKDVVVMMENDRDKLFHFRIAQRDDDDGSSEIRVEMTVDSDIYYLGLFEMDNESYQTFIKTQTYKKCKFENFAQHLAAILENARTNRSSYNVIFNGTLLTLEQRLEFKTVGIFRLEFHEEQRDNPYVVEQAQYRYHRKISACHDIENQLRELLDSVNKKNPTLCTQLKKALKYSLQD